MPLFIMVFMQIIRTNFRLLHCGRAATMRSFWVGLTESALRLIWMARKWGHLANIGVGITSLVNVNSVNERLMKLY